MSISISLFFVDHDAKLMAWAAIVCLIAAYGASKLLLKVQRQAGAARWVWAGVTALLIGLGAALTYYILLMGWHPSVPFSFTPGLIDSSLLVAVIIGAAGVAVATTGRSVAAHALGGAIVGLAAFAMQYFGKLATSIGGTIPWNTTLLIAALGFGMALGGLSFVLGLRRHIAAGTLCLAIAIFGTHAIALSAADFTLAVALPDTGKITAEMMVVGLSVLSIVALAMSFGSMVLDEADRRRAEAERQRQLDDAQRLNQVTTRFELASSHMAQGLCLFSQDGYLEFHNRKVIGLFGDKIGDRSLVGRHFRRLAFHLPGPIEEAGADSSVRAAQRIDELIARIIGGETVDYMRTLDDGRIIRFVHSPISEGGWVTTVDDVTAAQQSQAAIAHLAYHDSLTNILNRAAFNERLDNALEIAAETDVNFAVVAIDLDRFKEINDTYGHIVGDQVLKTVATRLGAGLKEGEVVARLGGDEFAALKMFTNADALREFLARVEIALFSPIVTDTVTITGAASVGVAVYPDDGDDRSRLLNNADLAMYRAKADHDRRVCYYEAEMDEHARARRAMAKDIWTALDEDQFHLVYQVQKSVETDAITGYEVLLRWNRPGHGPVGPADFIPVAEECGAISAIGTWVLRRACADAASWPEKHRIAVNISGVQVSQVELIDIVRDTLLQTGLPPSRLELEVTETAIIADKTRALHVLRQIKALGVTIAIDDFGTGYSSLDTLRSFPFDKIKIDRSFMSEADPNDQSKAIVRAILALGRSLSIPVLAEGVETKAQLDVLRAEGCSEAQGYLLGRPGTMDWQDRVEPLRRPN